MSIRVWLASRNPGKVHELQSLLAPSLRIRPWDQGVAPEETGQSYLENAMIKAQAVRRQTLEWVLADDSGLEVAALGGQPGPRSARYAGDDASDGANRVKLLAEMAELEGEARRARFVAVLVLLRIGYPALAVEGSCEGRIALAEAGSRGFGYDPIFVSDQLGVTFATATEEQKAAVSHRARAARKLLQELERSGAFDPGPAAG